MDQIVGIIALVFCAGIFGYQYAVRRKRQKISDFMAYDAGINEVAMGRKIDKKAYAKWKKHFEKELQEETEFWASIRNHEKMCMDKLEKKNRMQ